MRSSLMVAAVCAVGFATPAWAVPYASATMAVDSLKLSYVDTDPNDQIEASLVESGRGRNVISCLDGSGTVNTCLTHGNLSSEQTTDLTQTVSLYTRIPDLRLAASAGPSVTDVFLQGHAPTDAGLGVNANEYFSLSFSGAGRFTATVDYEVAAGGLTGSTWREVLAFVGIVMFGATGGHVQAEDVLVAPASGDASRRGTLNLTFDATDGDTYQFFLHSHLHSLAAPLIAAPVPEPETWALGLAGLALLVQQQRRRQRG